MKNPIVPVGIAAFAAATAADAQTQQTTVVRAPISAVAIGPAKAQVLVNTLPGDHTVLVRKPLVAVGTPFRSMRIRVN